MTSGRWHHRHGAVDCRGHSLGVLGVRPFGWVFSFCHSVFLSALLTTVLSVSADSAPGITNAATGRHSITERPFDVALVSAQAAHISLGGKGEDEAETTGADLTGVETTGADLTGAEAIGADPTGMANLSDLMPYYVVMDPPRINKLLMGNVTRVEVAVQTFHGTVNITDDINVNVCLTVTSQDDSIAKVKGPTTFSMVPSNDCDIYSNSSEDDDVWTHNDSRRCRYITVDVEGVFLGRTHLEFHVFPIVSSSFINDSDNHVTMCDNLNHVNNVSLNNTERHKNVSNSSDLWGVSTSPCAGHLVRHYDVAVLRGDTVVDYIFLGLVSLIVFFGNIGMGCKIDLTVVKETIRRPVAPLVGFTSQYVIMPVVAFAVGRLLALDPGLALGLFVMGCAPGGNSSNMYTFLLNGDVSLSITMTLVSTVASLAMIPLWLYTLGHVIIGDESNLHIPVQNIIISLAALVCPVLIGVILRRKRPKYADVVVKILKPLFITLILLTSTLGIYVSMFIFRLISVSVCLAGCLLPYVGFCLGALVAYVTRQPLYRVVTIAIETGLQNTGIAIIILKYSLPKPEADMTFVPPIVSTMFSPVPLIVAVIVVELRRRCCKKTEVTTKTDTEMEFASGSLHQTDRSDSSGKKAIWAPRDATDSNDPMSCDSLLHEQHTVNSSV